MIAAPAGQAKADLSGRHILLGGATGDVGIEIARVLLAAGANVTALVRSRSRADALGDHSRLRVIAGFPQSDAGVDDAVARLRDAGPLDGAVASLGPWFQGPPLRDLPLADWSRMLEASLTSHYVFARTAFGLMQPGSQYVMVNGGAALAPIPGSGVVSILARAQLMMGEVLAAENPGIGLHTLMLQSVIATRARPAADPAWMTAEEVGAACAWLFTDEGRLTAGSVLTLTARLSRRFT